ncbi:MAG TPA: ROK family transcriptional regulator [Amycolatopsis sp.]|nr:ROK family transcriptional regulator [Amycolatopsis sp.]
MPAAAVEHGRRVLSAAAVLRAVLDHGPVARSTIARLTRLSPAAVTGLAADLVERGLITETDGPVTRGGMGRPHIPLDIDTERLLVGGIHIAHDYATLTVLDLRGRVRAQDHVPHAGSDPGTVLPALARAFTTFLAERVGGRSPLAVGLATGGWVDSDAGVLVEHASLGWRDLPVREMLSRLIGLPVRLDSHARALASAELLFGAQPVRSSESSLHIFVGNVVDAAIVTGGSPLRGTRSAAGLIAHVPVGEPDMRCAQGHLGCFEATVADRTWVRRAAERGLGPVSSIKDIVDRALHGDSAARALLVERARRIGRAAAVLFDLVNPELLVVTEGGVIQLPECLAALRAEFGAHSHVGVDAQHAVRAGSFAAGDVLSTAAGAVELDAVYHRPLSFGA